MLLFVNMKFKGFDWDRGNKLKCQKHGLKIKDIEGFFCKNVIYVAPDLKHSHLETRFLAIGLGPNKKGIIVAFTVRDINQQRFIRPISARFMNKKEVDKYEKEFKKNKNR